MKAKVIQLSDFAHRRQTSPAASLSNASVTSLRDYKLTFSRGWLRFGPYYRRLTPMEAGDLSECLYWTLVSSTPGHPSTSKAVRGLVVVGEHPGVSIQGFGPPVRGEALHSLILELRSFCQRRTRRNRG